VGESQPSDLAAVVAIARAAQVAWAARPADERAALMRRAARLLEEQREPC
jgi:benzaldehyde dehydrogenase (NAD)